jgi:hypothetical protein
MSLAVLADHMASKGRGPDSMLIHMSPREVQGLQALAEHHGGTLTINPDTGLPEANFLEKLLPTIIGAGISYFSGGTIDPMTAAAMVGGVETARTGDIGRGISAGFQAYGGANLTSNLSEMGSAAIGAESAASGLTMSPELLAEFGGDLERGISAKDLMLQQQVTDRMAAATPFEKLSYGAEAFKNNPLASLKANAMPIAGAFGPAILAEMSAKSNMPQTVTKPGMITPYSYFGGQYVAGAPFQATPTRAAGGGLMGMDDGGYSPGQLDFTQRSEPVVRMAEGGIAHFVLGGEVKGALEAAYAANDVNKINEIARANMVTAADIADTYKGFDTSGIKGLQLYTPPNFGDSVKAVLGGGGGGAPVDYNKVATNLVTTAAANPNITTSDFITSANTAGLGLTQPLATALDKSGLSRAAQYSLTHSDIGSPLNAEETYGGLKGLSSNINFGIDTLRKAGETGASAREKALIEMNKYSINEADIYRATGKTLAELFPDEIKKATQIIANQNNSTTIIPGVNDYGLGGTNTSGNLEDVYGPALPPGVSGAGITTVNPNGTITTRPDIPGIGDGFTGMKDVRDTYEAGGGSLGVNKNIFVPKTYKELEDRFKLTGGSKQAMDYLTGKTKYSPIPYTEDGQIAKSYAESVMKLPVASSSKMYIFKNGKYEVNPDYAIPTYDKEGKKSYNLTNADVKTFMDNKPSTDAFYTWATTNNLSPEQIALASGRPINEISKLFTGAKDLVGEDGKIDQAKLDEKTAEDEKANFDYVAYLKANPDVQAELDAGKANFGTKDDPAAAAYEHYLRYGKAGGRKYIKKAAGGGLMNMAMARGGMSQQFNLGDYSDGGRLLRGPGDGISDSIPATIGGKRPARLADGEFVVPARIVSELGNGSTEAGARKLYAMMDRVQRARRGTVGKGRVAKNSRADKHLPA